MGREVKRVPLDFQWPLKETWSGYLMPAHIRSVTCAPCDGSGYNPETHQLSKDWYDHDNFGSRWWYDYKTDLDGQPAERAPWKVFGETRRWQFDLDQDEVDNLIAAGRLNGYVNTWNDQTRVWERDPAKPWPTAAQINRDMQFGFGHDCINHHICVEFRAKKRGFYGLCPQCQGEGAIWASPEIKAEAEAWTRSEPPEGAGWQMWETTSDGSPISPVFDTPTKLAAWLVRNRASAFGNDGASFAGWMATIGAGWAPGLVGDASGLRSGVAAAMDRTRPVFNVYESVSRTPPREEIYQTVLLGQGRVEHHRRPARPTIEYRFEAIYPDAADPAAAADLKAWLDDRAIRTRTEVIGADVILSGALAPTLAFEFKTRWI